MQIQSSVMKSQSFRPSKESLPVSEDSTFGLDFDPFSGVKDVVGTAVEEVVEFGIGATPILGANSHFENAIFGRSKYSRPGILLNLAGTVGLAVAGGMALSGVDPTIALGGSLASLAGSGIFMAMSD